MDTPKYALHIAFPDGSPSFVRGWEAGQVYETMQRGDTPINGQCHAANEEVLRRTADAEGYGISFAPIKGFPEYLTYTATRTPRVTHAS